VFQLLPSFGAFREDTEAMGDTEVEAMAEATITIKTGFL
jgi:hypothetical protein